MSMERLLRYLFAMAWGALPALIFCLVLLPLRRRRLSKLGLFSSPVREVFLTLFWMFAAAMALLTLTPRWVVSALVDVWNGYRWNGAEYPYFAVGTISLRPFQTLYDPFIFIGNVAMFLPFGFLVPLLWRRFGWRKAAALGAGITLFVETCQLSVGRAFDVDDLMLNALGVLLGYGAWRLWQRLAPGRAEGLWCREIKKCE